METSAIGSQAPSGKTDGVFHVCGKATNFFSVSRYFDVFSGGEGGGAVENPVENVDKQPRGGKLTGIILGRYVTRKLPLVVPKQRVSNCNFSVEMPKRGKIFLFYFALCYGNFGACLL